MMSDSQPHGSMSPDIFPRISVITVVFNGERYLEQAIRSVLAQDYPDLEYILVDGGSTDGTLDIVRKYETRIARWISEPDRGLYDAMNKGIKLATGNLIGLLNSDDWYHQGALREVGKAFASREDFSEPVICGKWILEFEDLGLSVVASPSLKFRVGMPIAHPAMFVPRSFYRLLGGYDTTYRFAADLEMAIRLFRANAQFRFLDAKLVHFRTSGASEKHFRESGREAVQILRDALPTREYLLFRAIRWKYETMTRAARLTERLLGPGISAKIRRAYILAKTRWSGSWLPG